MLDYTIIFWINVLSLFFLIYIYVGYVLLLKFIALFVKRKSHTHSSFSLPSVTVLLTVYNEKDKILSRIKNILSCNYPHKQLQILVASDGSTDGTDDIVSNFSFQDSRIKLYRPSERKGKSETQNDAISKCLGEIVVFTDADTKFDRKFLKEIVFVFQNERIGVVDGRLIFINSDGNHVSKNQSLYWSLELQMRKLESHFGFLAVASGACLAIRKKLFRPMPANVGEDCIIPLDVIEQGYKVSHAEKAIAFDIMENDLESIFSSRVRMTLRNWQGTWAYAKLLNPFSFPKVAFSLWSHKILRWLSPMFLLIWLASSFTLFTYDFKSYITYPAFVFIILGIAGFTGFRFVGASFIFSFCLANLGFAIGIFKAIMGKKITFYRE